MVLSRLPSSNLAPFSTSSVPSKPDAEQDRKDQPSVRQVASTNSDEMLHEAHQHHQAFNSHASLVVAERTWMVDQQSTSFAMQTGRITYEYLKEITDNFSEERELGAGASGKVFRGVSKYGGKVAVKLLYERPGLRDQQFENELNNLKIIKHPNIVSLLGHCNETHEVPVWFNGRVVLAEKIHRALCFEYMENGNLKRHLYDESCGPDWNTRYKIIKGICEGLKYLHKGLGNPIYHLDLKPENILLDKNMVPKLADFGLSKILSEDKTRSTANSYGTRGYIPPEYIDRNIISSKFDIFSLGVIIIKMVTGPEGYTESADMSEQDFIDRAEKNWRNRLQANYNGSLLDAYCQQVKMCVQLGLNCVVKDRHKRPDIVTLIKKLRGTEYLSNESRIDLRNKDASRKNPFLDNADSLLGIAALAYLLIPYLHSFLGIAALALACSHSTMHSLARALFPPNPKHTAWHAPSSAATALSKTEVEAIMATIGLAAAARGKGLAPAMGLDDVQALFDSEEPSFAEVRAVFAVFDADRDGFIGAEDLQGVLARLGVRQDDAACRAMVVASGGDGDGRMNFFQFVTFLENGLC